MKNELRYICCSFTENGSFGYGFWLDGRRFYYRSMIGIVHLYMALDDCQERYSSELHMYEQIKKRWHSGLKFGTGEHYEVKFKKDFS